MDADDCLKARLRFDKLNNRSKSRVADIVVSIKSSPKRDATHSEIFPRTNLLFL